MCINAGTVALSGNPVGGTFSGTGVVGNNFDPSVSGAGTFVITYTYTDANGCTNSDNTSITVNPLPVVTISPLAAMCISASAVALNGTPAGGTFTGVGVVGNNFDPSVSGAGTFVITYTYTDANGCTNSDNTSVTVNPLPVVTISPLAAMCISASPVALSGTPAGGTFTGVGVVGNNFDPSVSGAGTFVVTYTYTDANGCTNSDNTSVTVNPLPVVTISPVAAMCISAGPVALV